MDTRKTIMKSIREDFQKLEAAYAITGKEGFMEAVLNMIQEHLLWKIRLETDKFGAYRVIKEEL